MDEFLPIKSFRVKNFKGIRDSGEVRFTPLTVFIGNNGSGKSSLIEALQTYQDIVVNGLDKAMNRWRGFENIHNPPISLTGNGMTVYTPIEFVINGYTNRRDFLHSEMITRLIPYNEHNQERLLISDELVQINGKEFLQRNEHGNIFVSQKSATDLVNMGTNYSILSKRIGLLLIPYLDLHNRFEDSDEPQRFNKFVDLINYWQFATLNPANMTQPIPQRRSEGDIILETDGSNIAEYLLDIRKQSQDAYDGIIESLTVVLPYLKDMQPNITTELERTVYLRMHEDSYTIPQWLLSTGTMRILCLLALFRHPTPPPVIFIEELENGLDPRTIHFIVEEIRSLIESGKSQVVITTHSPYLLDLLDLSQIVVVERENGETTFSRPADDEELKVWAKKFGPGSLYTMSKLTRG